MQKLLDVRDSDLPARQMHESLRGDEATAASRGGDESTGLQENPRECRCISEYVEDVPGRAHLTREAPQLGHLSCHGPRVPTGGESQLSVMCQQALQMRV